MNAPVTSPSPEPSQNNRRPWARRLLKILGIALLLLVCAVLLWFRGALYNRFFRFPREEAAWRDIRAERQPVIDHSGWNEYRGILHAHSTFSHDSEVPLEEIWRILQATRIDFICLSDHPINGRADFDLQ